MPTPLRPMLLVIPALLVLTAGIAVAEPCSPTLAHPVKARGLSASLVQAFIACDPEFGGNDPNATTETGTIPSCYPAETFHGNAGSPDDGWTWGPKSKGSVRFQAGTNALVHPLNTDPEAGDVSITITLSDIRDNAGIAHDATGFATGIFRVTLIDRDEPSMPMTILDFPFSTSFQVWNGKVAHKTSLNAFLNFYMQPAFPRCTSFELVGFQVQDPNGNPFATMGIHLP